MMGRLRRIIAGIGAGVVGISALLAVIPAAPASASLPKGTGVYWCTPFHAKLAFSPAWSDSGVGQR